MWLLSSKNNLGNDTLDLKINFSDQFLYTDEQIFEYKTNSIHLAVFGNPWPRFEIQKDNLNKTKFNWLISCIDINKMNFINYIKGDFVIFIELNKILYVFNDHFGFSQVYVNTKNGNVSNNFKLLRTQSNSFNDLAIAQHILYNRTIGETTFDKNIENKEGANLIEFSSGIIKYGKYWDYKESLINNSDKYSLQDIIDFSIQNTSFFYKFFDVDQTHVTLTGGKDSRSALALLLNQGITPIGINYGSDKSKDIVYAKKLAEKIGIDCKTIHVKPNSEKYYFLLDELMNQFPMTSIHRAHRYAAFKEIRPKKEDFNVLFNGYLGGELLMGIYPDKLVFTQHVLTQIGISKTEDKKTNYFETNLMTNIFKNQVKNKTVLTNELDAIFNIGIKHHLQDIHLSKEYCNYVFPFFLDIDFIERIFNSNFNFSHVDNRSKNLFKRYHLYQFNCELQYQSSPQLRTIPFAKKGNYTLTDYKKGPLFWSFKKVLNHIKEKKYPPNFVYDNNYLSWVIEQLEEISLDKNLTIHDYFNVSEALNILKKDIKTTFSESEILPYTRIIMFSNYLSN